MSAEQAHPREPVGEVPAELRAHLATVDLFLWGGRLAAMFLGAVLLFLARRQFDGVFWLYVAGTVTYLVWEHFFVPASSSQQASPRRKAGIFTEFCLLGFFLEYTYHLSPPLVLLLGLAVVGYATRYGGSSRTPIFLGVSVASGLLISQNIANFTRVEWFTSAVGVVILQLMGYLAALSTQRVFQLATSLAHAARRSRLLLEVLQTSNRAMSVEERLHDATTAMERLIGYRPGFFGYDPSRNEFFLQVTRLFAREQASGLRFPPEGTMFGEVLKTRKPIIVRDLPNHPGMPATLRGKVPFKVAAIIPIEYGGEFLGTMNPGLDDRTEIPTDDLDILVALAGILGQSIYNARRHEEAERLSVIDELTGLYNHRYFQAQLGAWIHRAAAHGNAFTLAMLDLDDFKVYNDLFGHQQGDEVLRQVGGVLLGLFPAGGEDGVVARYGGEEFVLLLPGGEAEAWRRCEAAREAIGNHPFPGCSALELGRVSISLGAAVFPEQADGRDTLIAAADTALYRAKHLGKNRCEFYTSVLDAIETEVKEESELGLIRTIKPLVSVINGKDNYTYGHSERVVERAVAIGQRLGLSQHDLQFLSYAAFLHDLGKLEIGRELLNKPDALTKEERWTLEQHPVWGAEMVGNISSLRTIVPAILHHHERWDGGGYPDGLTGEEIPLFARIIAVADSFDAMITTRPYRREKSVGTALAEILVCGGSQFDPEIAQVFYDYMVAEESVARPA